MISTIPEAYDNSTANNTPANVPKGDVGLQPVFFLAPLGLVLLGIAARTIGNSNTWPDWIAEIFTYFGALSFVLVAALYVYKGLANRGSLLADLRNPLHVSFLGAVPASIFLIGVIIQTHVENIPVLQWLPLVLAVIGAILLIGLAFTQFSRWLDQAVDLRTYNPLLTILIAGFFIASVAFLRLGVSDVAWPFFGAGVLSWIVFFPVIIMQGSQKERLPALLAPSYSLLILPPALALVNWITITGGVLDAYTELLLATTLFSTILILAKIRFFLKLPVSQCWWCYVIALTALTQSLLFYTQILPSGWMNIIMLFAAGLSVAGAGFMVWLSGKALWQQVQSLTVRRK